MKNLLNILILLFFATGITDAQNSSGIFVDFSKLDKVKTSIQQEDKTYLSAYKNLIVKADEALNDGTFSVTTKLRTPPSGDKHDYLSMGPYWWPDSSKADGLPYIRKDGVVNPETRGAFVDVTTKNKFFNNVEVLGWGFYFSGDKKYADKALELLAVWFIHRETRMNPNLNFAQGIPGRMNGRGIGIIDWAGINRLIAPLQILEASGILTGESKQEIHRWFEEYLTWLLTSKYGVDEDEYFNNHGTWYDVQIAAIQQYLGKADDAKKRLETKTKARIASQIEPDGSQPHELARTKSMGYSTMNLRGFLHLAWYGKNLGVDLWNFKTTDGRSIKAALEYLMPYASNQKEWTYQQLGHMDEAIENLKIDFLMAASLTGNQEYIKIAKTIKAPEENLETLLYPILN